MAKDKGKAREAPSRAKTPVPPTQKGPEGSDEYSTQEFSEETKEYIRKEFPAWDG